LSRRSTEYTGNFAIDEDVLREEGVTDFEQYACKKGIKVLKSC
jgi:citronellol/citronellal dehydrogenase